MKRVLGRIVLVTLVLLVLIQLVPYGRSHENPAVSAEPQWDSPRTRELVKRVCFDCHSNETVWPWYGETAPFSWVFAHDVNKGRDKLNFSEWGRLSQAERDRLMAEIWKQVKSGSMPPAMYVFGHQEARVTTDHHQMIRDWCGVPPN